MGVGSNVGGSFITLFYHRSKTLVNDEQHCFYIFVTKCVSELRKNAKHPVL